VSVGPFLFPREGLQDGSGVFAWPGMSGPAVRKAIFGGCSKSATNRQDSWGTTTSEHGSA
jgi:hypothetical protein